MRTTTFVFMEKKKENIYLVMSLIWSYANKGDSN